MSGYTEILSNEATYYGEPRFNFYSADVGQSVFFEQTYTLLTGSFTETLFDTNFTYNESGYVDFTDAIPEPSSAAMIGLLSGGIWFIRRRFAC